VLIDWLKLERRGLAAFVVLHEFRAGGCLHGSRAGHLAKWKVDSAPSEPGCSSVIRLGWRIKEDARRTPQASRAAR
jgi:hypothetical protein